jgi:hypothetical protein
MPGTAQLDKDGQARRDGNGKIDQKNELFGDSPEAVNGFEALREFDTNHDGWISKKDKNFAKLVLWFDRNGDGKMTPDEVVPASQIIEKISLKYSKGHLRPIGRHAEEREVATVILKKHHQKVQVADIWLSPIFESSGKLSDNRKPSNSP